MTKYLSSRGEAVSILEQWRRQLSAILVNHPNVKEMDPVVVPDNFFTRKIRPGKPRTESQRDIIFGFDFPHVMILGMLSKLSTSDNVAPVVAVGIKDRSEKIKLGNGISFFQEYYLTETGPKLGIVVDRADAYTATVEACLAPNTIDGEEAEIEHASFTEKMMTTEADEIVPQMNEIEDIIAVKSGKTSPILISKPDSIGMVHLHIPVIKMHKYLAEAIIAIVGCSKR